ncbi:MAG: SIR2 family protein [Gemmatimonadetes bacterium]|nr:SIR2 family protein [Gemmatimonadota bacterium]
MTRLAFAVYGNLGVYALLLGSGLSGAAGIPTGWEITLDLIRRVAMAQGETDQPDWSAWYMGKFGKEPSYPELIAQLGPSPDERRAILNGYIEPTEDDLQQGRKMPTRAHHAIAGLVQRGMVRVFITTNFDRLLEQALRERGIEPTVVDSVHAIRGAEPITHARCYLLKLHGDYKDSRIRNTDLELSEYPAKFNTLLDRIFEDHGLIVCGWSGAWDVALYDSILECRSRRYSTYWAAHGPLEDAAQRIVTQHRGQILPIADADSFFGHLENQVQSLAHTHRRNPENVDLLVATTKRFAADHNRRIDLNDLLESEVRRCLHTLHSSMPEVDATIAGAEQLIAFQQSTAEPLGRMLGVLGRWGDGTEHDSAVNGLLAVWLQAAESTPAIAYLRHYPAVLLLWAYGIGLTIANRWRDLHNLLSHPVNTGQGAPQRLVSIVSDWLLEGYRNELWKRLPDHQNSRTPDSDHRYRVLDGWRDSFADVFPDFEDLHDMWEILLALIYCEPAPGERVRDGWTPVGRNVWRHQSRVRILGRFADGDLHNELVAAGLAGGSGDRLAANLKTYADFMERMR